MRVIRAVILLVVAMMLFLSLFSYDPMDVAYNTTSPNYPAGNSAGIIGAWVAFAALFAFGFSAYAIVVVVVLAAAVILFKPAESPAGPVWLRLLCAVLMVVSAACLFQCVRYDPLVFAAREMNIAGAGGVVGMSLCDNIMLPYCGLPCSIIIYAAVLAASLFAFTRFNIFSFVGSLFSRTFNAARRGATDTAEVYKRKRRTVPIGTRKVRVRQSRKPTRRPRKAKIVLAPSPGVQSELIPSGTAPKKTSRKSRKKTARRRPAPTARKRKRGGAYSLPPINLLNKNVEGKGRKAEESLQKNIDILQETLKEFGIEAEVGNVIRGPVITRYEVHPAPGVKVQKITTLADDIALAMAASSIRIVAPIPGKAAIGIEIPNIKATLVGLREMLSSSEYERTKRRIPLAVGKEISGKPIIGDLAEMPHLLIAGATGSGKTVCVNSLILTLIYSLTPDELKLILVDPKRVEMTQYRGLPHLLTPVITDARKVTQALRWAGREMERRYELFSDHLARDLVGYNKKISRKGVPAGEDGEPLQPLPYIVIIVDELADLMLVARKDIEDPIIRLAQMGRASGIHLILATQRPSVNVITGLIKANFPTRIAFKVASKVDSKVILDTMGADKLIGKGDMIFVPPGTSRKLRIQGTLVEDTEIDAAVEFVKSQASPEYRDDIFVEGGDEGLSYEDMQDSLYDDAVKMVMQLGQASASMLQRRMRIGYTRAARLVDMMEERGIVGPQQGSKPREIIGGGS